MGARFLTRDPIEAITRSAYGYAGNDPVNFTDPSGMCPWCVVGGIALIEVGFSLWDAYDAYTTFNDGCAGGLSKAAAGGFFLLGLFAPGGGYGALDDLSDAARMLDRSGGFTVAGRQYTKHAGGQRVGSGAFPPLRGAPHEINEIAQFQVDDILTAPGSRFVRRLHPVHGNVLDVIAPDGRGIRYGPGGNFIGFLEPSR